MKRELNCYQGCIIGGAIGDALGLPVEFLSLAEIQRHYGDQGITDLVPGAGGKALISDDTQMTMFTAEGILRAVARGTERGVCQITSVVHNAYLRWLETQGYNTHLDEADGWLIKVRALHSRRGPGSTCLSALASGQQGTMEEPLNNSKGCGGVMRSAPVGLLYTRRRAFKLACECAALTHGHPSGYLSAGSLAHIIACIREGMGLEDAVQDALAELQKYKGHEECTEAVSKGLALAGENSSPQECIPQLGEGWVGEEALAIAVYCALKYRDNFRQGVIAAVNHNGDSDSTGAITGNILGALLGIEQIPQTWVETVELKDELMELAEDMLIKYKDTGDWWEKYPGW